MAITLKTDYRKTLGLPGYSSHSFSASVEVELTDIGNAPREIQELYETLQSNVDEQIKVTGFIPPDTYGMDDHSSVQQPARNVTPISSSPEWKCSDKQQELILKVIDEKQIDKKEVEDLANKLFRKSVKSLNKLEASGLIERLFEYPSPKKANKSKSYSKGGRR